MFSKNSFKTTKPINLNEKKKKEIKTIQKHKPKKLSSSVMKPALVSLVFVCDSSSPTRLVFKINKSPVMSLIKKN